MLGIVPMQCYKYLWFCVKSVQKWIMTKYINIIIQTNILYNILFCRVFFLIQSYLQNFSLSINTGCSFEHQHIKFMFDRSKHSSLVYILLISG